MKNQYHSIDYDAMKETSTFGNGGSNVTEYGSNIMTPGLVPSSDMIIGKRSFIGSPSVTPTYKAQRTNN